MVGFAMAAPVGEVADVGGSLPAVKNGCEGGRRYPLFRHPYPTNPTRDGTKIRVKTATASVRLRLRMALNASGD